MKRSRRLVTPPFVSIRYAAVLLAIVLPASSFAAPASRPRLALYALSNETGNTVYDSACAGAERSLAITLRQLGLYDLESQPRSIGRSDEELRAAAVEQNADFVMFGGIGAVQGKRLVFRLGLFDRAKGRTTLFRESDGVSALELFEAIDGVVSKVLDGITGGHIAFGSVSLRNTGEAGSYRVLLDGIDAGDDLTELPRVLTGRHTLSILQRRMLGPAEVARSSFTIEEGENREITFSIPYLTEAEKTKLETIETELRGEWERPGVAAKTESRVVAYAALLKDVAYSPRLAEYQVQARQLEAEWALLKNRFEIEENVWTPDSLLLDPSMVVYLTAKNYPDPESLRRGAESNASLLATLHEIAAGEAMANGRYEAGVQFLESILDFSRYLPSTRKAEYAFAVAKIKDLVALKATDPGKFRYDLETVFGPQMQAGVKLRSLEAEAKRGGLAVLISSDNGARLSFGTALPQSGPLLVKPGDSLSVLLSREDSSSTVKLAVPEGRRVAFLDGGFSSFGRTKSEIEPMIPLRFIGMPKEYTVFVNGENAGVTPLEQAWVHAGPLSVRFEKKGEGTKVIQTFAESGKENVIVWGEAAEIPIRLARRTIPLAEAGEADAWEGIEPLLEGNFQHSYPPLSDPEYAVSRVYLCRDGRYLYSRVDFAKINPFSKPPKDAHLSVTLKTSLRFEPTKSLDFHLIKRNDEKKGDVDGWQELYDIRSWSGMDGSRLKPIVHLGPSSIIQKFPLSNLRKYCKGVVPITFSLASSPTGTRWSSGTVVTPPRYIEFPD